MAIVNEEALAVRARNLGSFNGIQLVLVAELEPEVNPTQAILEVHFFNANQLSAIAADLAAPREIFPITGGHRVPAGPLSDQVQAVAIEEVPGRDTVLRLTVAPVGDYSTYTLSLAYDLIDPLFGEIDFKFRPGCFTNCLPERDTSPSPPDEPVIDYRAKDYDSFRHTLMTWMADRVPGWHPTSEADFDQVILDLFSASADELSDYQDRVVNEAYLSTSRKRVPLARHARLMDYHVHQGNQARTWLALHVDPPGSVTLNDSFLVGTGSLGDESTAVFATRQAQQMHPLLNRFGLYTWSGAVPALDAGSTEADLLLYTADGSSADDAASATTVQDLIRGGTVRHLLIQEHLNPRTGAERGRDPTRRQVLNLLDGQEGAEAREDPVAGRWYVRVRWREQDQLKRSYCFAVDTPDGVMEDVSQFHGNLVPAFHGRPRTIRFQDPRDPLTDPDSYHYEREGRYGTICQLPEGPLAYRDTPAGGEVPPRSTLSVEIEVDGIRDPWDEVVSLVHSDDSDEGGDHFVVETDEMQESWIRFGNGVNGRALPAGAVVHCRYQQGYGPDGNVGRDVLRFYDEATYPRVTEAWNPFDVTSGRAPEPRNQIVRRAPEAYRHRQLRAVTLKDYIDRAEELPGVARAAAKYRWTGSWRTVRVVIDQAGTSRLTQELRGRVSRHLEAVRLIGEDLEIRAPRFVPLEINISLCLLQDYWPEAVRYVLEQEFSTGYTPDGRMAFFHPDRWTFGQPLRASQILGRIHAVTGVDSVLGVTLQRWNSATPGMPDRIEVDASEIILVENDPDQMERGSITFDLRGGRR